MANEVVAADAHEDIHYEYIWLSDDEVVSETVNSTIVESVIDNRTIQENESLGKGDDECEKGDKKEFEKESNDIDIMSHLQEEPLSKKESDKTDKTNAQDIKLRTCNIQAISSSVIGMVTEGTDLKECISGNIKASDCDRTGNENLRDAARNNFTKSNNGNFVSLLNVSDLPFEKLESHENFKDESVRQDERVLLEHDNDTIKSTDIEYIPENCNQAGNNCEESNTKIKTFIAADGQVNICKNNEADSFDEAGLSWKPKPDLQLYTGRRKSRINFRLKESWHGNKVSNLGTKTGKYLLNGKITKTMKTYEKQGSDFNCLTKHRFKDTAKELPECVNAKKHSRKLDPDTLNEEIVVSDRSFGKYHQKREFWIRKDKVLHNVKNSGKDTNTETENVVEEVKACDTVSSGSKRYQMDKHSITKEKTKDTEIAKIAEIDINEEKDDCLIDENIQTIIPSKMMFMPTPTTVRLLGKQIKELMRTRGQIKYSKRSENRTSILSDGTHNLYSFDDEAEDQHTNVSDWSCRRMPSSKPKDSVLQKQLQEFETKDNRLGSSENVRDKICDKIEENYDNGRDKQLTDLVETKAGSGFVGEEASVAQERIDIENTATFLSSENLVNKSESVLSKEAKDLKRKYYRRNRMKVFRTINGVQKMSERCPCKFCGELFSSSYVRFHEHKHATLGQQKVLCRPNTSKEIVATDKGFTRKSKKAKNITSTLSQHTCIGEETTKGHFVETNTNKMESTFEIKENMQDKHGEIYDYGKGSSEDLGETVTASALGVDEASSSQIKVNSIVDTAAPIRLKNPKKSESVSGKEFKDIKRKYYRRNPVKLYRTMNGVQKIAKRCPCKYCGELFSSNYVRCHEHKHCAEGQQKVLCRGNKNKEDAHEDTQINDFKGTEIMKTYKGLTRKSRDEKSKAKTLLQDATGDDADQIGDKNKNVIEFRKVSLEDRNNVMLQANGHGVKTDNNKIESTENIGEKVKDKKRGKIDCGKGISKAFGKIIEGAELKDDEAPNIKIKMNNMYDVTAPLSPENPTSYSESVLGKDVRILKRKYIRRNPIKVCRTINGVQKISKRYPCRYCGELFSWSYVRFHEHKHGTGGQQKVLCRRKRCENIAETDDMASKNILKRYKSLGKKSRGTKNTLNNLSQGANDIKRVEDETKDNYTNMTELTMSYKRGMSLENRDDAMLLTKGHCVARESNKKESTVHVGEKLQDGNDENSEDEKSRPRKLEKAIAGSALEDNESFEIQEEINGVHNAAKSVSPENLTNDSKNALGKEVRISKRKYYRRHPIKVFKTKNGVQMIAKRYPCKFCGELFSSNYVRHHENKHGTDGQQKVLCRQNTSEKVTSAVAFRDRQILKTYKGLIRKSKEEKNKISILSGVKDETKDKYTNLTKWKMNYKREESQKDKDNVTLQAKGLGDEEDNIGEKVQDKNDDEICESQKSIPEVLVKTTASREVEDVQASNNQEKIKNIQNTALPNPLNDSKSAIGRNVKNLKRKNIRRNPVKVYRTINGVQKISKRYPCRYCGELFSWSYVRFHEHKHGIGGQHKVLCRTKRSQNIAETDDMASKQILKTYKNLREKRRATKRKACTLSQSSTVVDGTADQCNWTKQKTSPSDLEPMTHNDMVCPKEHVAETGSKIEPEEDIEDTMLEMSDEASENGKFKHKEPVKTLTGCTFEEGKVSMKNDRFKNIGSSIENQTNYKYRALGKELKDSKRVYYRRKPVKVYNIINGIQQISKRYPCRYCGELFSLSYIRFHEHKHGTGGQKKVFCRRKRHQKIAEADELAAFNESLHHVHRTRHSENGNSKRKEIRKKVKSEKIKVEDENDSVSSHNQGYSKPLQSGVNEMGKCERESAREEIEDVKKWERKTKGKFKQEAEYVNNQERDTSDTIAVSNLDKSVGCISKVKLDGTICEICPAELESWQDYKLDKTSEVFVDRGCKVEISDDIEKASHGSVVAKSVKNHHTELSAVLNYNEPVQYNRHDFIDIGEDNCDHVIVNDVEDKKVVSSLQLPVYPLVKKLTLKDGETVYSPVDNAIEVFEKESNIKQNYRKIRVLSIDTDSDGCLEEQGEGEYITQAQGDVSDDRNCTDSQSTPLNENIASISNEAEDLSVKTVDTERDLGNEKKTISLAFEIQIDLDGIANTTILPQLSNQICNIENSIGDKSLIGNNKSAHTRIIVKSLNVVGNFGTKNIDTNDIVRKEQESMNNDKQVECNSQSNERNEAVNEVDNGTGNADHSGMKLDTLNDHFALPEIGDGDIYYASKLQEKPCIRDVAYGTNTDCLDMDVNTNDDAGETSMFDTGETKENDNSKQGKKNESEGRSTGDSDMKNSGNANERDESYTGGRDDGDGDGRGNRDSNNNENNRDENHNVELFACLVCQETFNTKTELLRHLTKIHRLTNMCQICYFDEGEIRRFANPVSLRNHKVRDHPEDMVKCVCGAMLIDNKMLSSHLKKFKCNIYDTVGESSEMAKCICGKRFASQEFLFNHRSKCRKRHCLDDTFLEYMSSDQKGKRRCLKTSTSDNVRNNDNDNSGMTLRAKVAKDNTSMSEDSDTSHGRSSKGRKCKENVITYSERLYDKYFETAVKTSTYKQSQRKSYSQQQGMRRYERLSTDAPRLSDSNAVLDLRTKSVRDRNNNPVSVSNDSISQDINNNVPLETWTASTSSFNPASRSGLNICKVGTRSKQSKHRLRGNGSAKRDSFPKRFQSETGMQTQLEGGSGKQLSGQLQTVRQLRKCRRTKRMKNLQPEVKGDCPNITCKRYRCHKRNTHKMICHGRKQWALIRSNPSQNNSDKSVKYRCNWCRFVSVHWGTAVRHHYMLHQEKELDFIRLKTVPDKSLRGPTITSEESVERLKEQELGIVEEQNIEPVIDNFTENLLGSETEINLNSVTVNSIESVTESNMGKDSENNMESVTVNNMDKDSENNMESVTVNNMDKDSENNMEIVKESVESVTQNNLKIITGKKEESVTHKQMDSFTEQIVQNVTDQTFESVAETNLECVMECEINSVTENNMESAIEYGFESATENDMDSILENIESVTEHSIAGVTEHNFGSATESKAESVTENNMECVTENNAESVTQNNMECVTENNAESVTENNMECVTENNMEFVTENNMECVTEHYMKSVADNNTESVTENNAESVSECIMESATENNMDNTPEKI